jgi:CspA family cold shock protein
MRKGTVKFFNLKKGFGFITDEKTGTALYVHEEDCEDIITDGDEVLFEVKDGEKGPQAFNVEQFFEDDEDDD